MRISRLYVTTPLQIGQTYNLDDDNAHYVRTVLRLKNDNVIVLFNGEGYEYHGKLVEVSRKSVRINIEQKNARDVESCLKIHLGLGISRGDRMDWSVQKAVELGVYSITPLLTARSVVQLNTEKKAQRFLHWQRIIQHAAEQSGRTYLPRLHPICELADWIKQQHALKIFLDPYAQKTLNQLTPENHEVALLVGVEGGFAQQERDIAIATDFIPVRLGKRILRTETASLTALSAVQMLWGDFGV